MAGYTIVVPNAFGLSGQTLTDAIPKIGVQVDAAGNTVPGAINKGKKVPKYDAYSPISGTPAWESRDKLAGSYATLTFGQTGGESGEYVGRFVRRPLSGIAIKPNTHATVSVVDSNGNAVAIFNNLGSTSPRGTSTSFIKPDTAAGSINSLKIDDAQAALPANNTWTDWFLQSVVESRQEKIQITETFDHTVFSAFGQKPRFLVFQGFLMNTSDFPWRAQFWHNWDLYFRATKLVERNQRVMIHWEDIVVQGFPVNATAKQNAKNPNMIGFQFSFFVTHYMNMSMENVGLLQRLQSQKLDTTGLKGLGETLQDLSGDWYSVRSAEFAGDGVFSYQGATGAALKSKEVLQAVGGVNLMYNEWLKEIGFGAYGHWSREGDGLGPYGQSLLGGSLYGSLMGSRARWLKGGVQARAMLVNMVAQASRQWATAGLDAAQRAIFGKGSRLLNQRKSDYFLGMVGQLYESVIFKAMNGMKWDNSEQLKDANGNVMKTVTGATIYISNFDRGTKAVGDPLKPGTTSLGVLNDTLLTEDRWDDPTTKVEDVFTMGKWAKWGSMMARSGNIKYITDMAAYSLTSLAYEAMYFADSDQIMADSLVSVEGAYGHYAASTQMRKSGVSKSNPNISFKDKATWNSPISQGASLVKTIDGTEYGAGPDAEGEFFKSTDITGTSTDTPWWKGGAVATFNPKEEGDGSAWEYVYDFGNTSIAGSKTPEGTTQKEWNAKLGMEKQAEYQEAVAAQANGDYDNQHAGKSNHTVGTKLDDDDIDDDGSDPAGGYDDSAEFPGWEFQQNPDD